MFFTSAIVAQSHYQGKTHAKRVRLVLGEPPSTPTTVSSPDSTSIASQPADQPTPPDWPPTNDSEAGKFCCLCGAWFNNPLMAQQHYEGKKHKRNAARARLLEQLAGSLGATETTVLRSRYSCAMCNMILNSIEQYHAHLQGSKHQNKVIKRERINAVNLPPDGKEHQLEAAAVRSCRPTSVEPGISEGRRQHLYLETLGEEGFLCSWKNSQRHLWSAISLKQSWLSLVCDGTYYYAVTDYTKPYPV
ncbi:UNVERIFIED_CONTAM: hypothetical protein FKN15_016676 [Acipenser sinensis]